ncbi:MAG: hypothetical protein K9J77_08525 [Rhodoferax sp.]|nr:hypothetical protein [Rhodoferax sp.]
MQASYTAGSKYLGQTGQTQLIFGLGKREREMEQSAELKRPRKLAALAIGIAMLIVGSFHYQASDWDVPISIITAFFSYLTASWSLHVMVEHRWKQWPMMIF